MPILFLDGSGRPDERVFAVGAPIAVRADRWRELRERWSMALADGAWPADPESAPTAPRSPSFAEGFERMCSCGGLLRGDRARQPERAKDDRLRRFFEHLREEGDRVP